MELEDLARKIDRTEIKQLAQTKPKTRSKKTTEMGNWESSWALSTDMYFMAFCAPFSD